MYTIFRTFSSQYSRRLLSILARTKNNNKKTKLCCVATHDIICFLLLSSIYFITNLHSCANKIKKNAEHTRMYTNFRAFSSQYSRRLLSILAHHKKQKRKKTNRHDLPMRTVFVFLFCCNSEFSTFAQLCNTKKIRSTHTCTPLFATFYRNIHVGCCLFSHDPQQT